MRRVVLLALIGIAAAAAVAAVTAPRLHAQQRVTLRIRPPVGDTLRMEMEQQFDIASEDTGANGGGAPMEMTGALLVWTRAAVLGRKGTSTELVSITDSVVAQPPSAATLPPLRDAKRALEGRTVHLRVAEDGELTVANHGSNTAIGMGATMPSVLPASPVRIGETWTRDLRVPLSTTRNAVALVRTTFRLDSLGNDGAIAYVSLHGDVSHDHAEDHRGMTGRTTGTLTGTLQVDRRLAWITDSRTTVTLTSVVAPDGRAPRHMRMLVTQRIHALPPS